MFAYVSGGQMSTENWLALAGVLVAILTPTVSGLLSISKKLDVVIERLRNHDNAHDGHEKRLDDHDKRMNTVEQRVAVLEARKQ